MIFQDSEIINLLLSVILFILFYYILKRAQIYFPRLLLYAILTYIAGLIFTVVETYYWESLFNILEHFCYMGAAILFYFTMKELKTQVK